MQKCSLFSVCRCIYVTGSLGFGLFVRQKKQSEDITLGSFVTAFFIFSDMHVENEINH